MLVHGISQQPFFVAAQAVDVRARVSFPRHVGFGPPRVTAKSRKTITRPFTVARTLRTVPVEVEHRWIDDRDADQSEQIAQHRTLNAGVERRVYAQRRR